MAAREQQCMQPTGEIVTSVVEMPAAAPTTGEVVTLALPAAVPVAMAVTEYRIEVVTDAGVLAQLKPEWDALLAQSGIDHPFLSHEWICSWLQCFGAGKALHILLVKAGSRLAGIAPLLRGNKRMYGINASCLEALYNPHTPRFDFIVAPHEAEEVYRSIWRHLRGTTGWDMLELSQLRADSRTLAALSQLARRDGCALGIWHGEQSPYIPFTGTFESYFSQLSNNQRSNVRRRLSRLQEQGVVSLEEITAAEHIDSALDEGFRIEAAAWKAQNGTAIGSAPEVATFYRTFARHAAGMGALRLLFLTLDGRRIAFAYGLCYHNKLYVMKTGYDPEYSYYSPYILLCYLVFQDGFARGLDEYEFLGNNEAWKLAWARQTRRHDWLYIFAPTFHARLLYQIKFRWLPSLQRHRFYQRLRNTLFPDGKARVVARDGEQLPPAGN